MGDRAPLLPGGRSRAELEASLEAFFFREVRKVGGYPVKLPTTSGLPDRMILFRGARVYFVELKIEKRPDTAPRPSTLQKVRHERMRELGMRVEVIYGRDEIKDWIHRVVSLMGPQPTRPGRPSKKTEVPFDEDGAEPKTCSWCGHPDHTETIVCLFNRTCGCETQTL